jgi:hypothetical protein
MGTSYADDPKRWRERAEEARMQAEQMHTDDAKRSLLQVAATYDRMAERAGARIAGTRAPLVPRKR